MVILFHTIPVFLLNQSILAWFIKRCLILDWLLPFAWQHHMGHHTENSSELNYWTEDDEVGELWYIGVINSRQLQDQTKPNYPSTISHFPLLGFLFSILGLIFLLFHYFLFYGRNVVLVSPIQSNLLGGVLYYIINFTLSYYIVYF